MDKITEGVVASNPRPPGRVGYALRLVVGSLCVAALTAASFFAIAIAIWLAFDTDSETHPTLIEKVGQSVIVLQTAA
ncbi:MAG: hypothetical protein ACKO5K_14015 [Armatimonadota bacterium]